LHQLSRRGQHRRRRRLARLAGTRRETPIAPNRHEGGPGVDFAVQVCQTLILPRFFEFGSVPRGCAWHTCKRGLRLVYTGLWHTCTLVKKRGQKRSIFCRKPRVYQVGSRVSAGQFFSSQFIGSQNLSLEAGPRVDFLHDISEVNKRHDLVPI
jgi:hypothetical protein